MKRLWQRHPVLSALFVLSVVAMLFFAGRFTAQVVYWSDLAHRNQQVQAWMTVGYVARSWGLHGPDIDREAGLPLPQGHPLSLSQIAADRGVPVETIIAEVERAVVLLKTREAMRDVTDR